MRRLRVIRGWKDLPQGDRGAAVAMGSFDGVHRGHQRVIAAAAKAAAELGVQLGVITFDPHQRAYFRPDEPAFRLMKPDQQARALEALGVDVLYVLPFENLAEMTDREFAAQVLLEGLGAKQLTLFCRAGQTGCALFEVVQHGVFSFWNGEAVTHYFWFFRLDWLCCFGLLS